MERLAGPDEVRERQRWFMAHSHPVAGGGYILNEGANWRTFTYGALSDPTEPFGVAGGAEIGIGPTHAWCPKCPVSIVLPCPAVTIGQLRDEIITAPKQPFQRDTEYHIKKEFARAKVQGCLPPSRWQIPGL